jgi:REP element-mobilizing transposase RayT
MAIGADTFAYRGRLPHLNNEDKTYYVTFCTKDRKLLLPEARDLTLGCCVHGHPSLYLLHSAVVMPDHVHILMTPNADATVPRIMNGIKGASSHLVQRHFVSSGVLWQRESFDRIVRKTEDLAEIADYICNNPVRKGLVSRPDDYRWIWRSWVEGRTLSRT